jgi:hypothetical protein
MARMLGKGGRRGAERQEEGQPLHAAAPSIGRTVTTRIMPACMWSIRWQ